MSVSEGYERIICYRMSLDSLRRFELGPVTQATGAIKISRLQNDRVECTGQSLMEANNKVAALAMAIAMAEQIYADQVIEDHVIFCTAF